jgi:ankyrin repeat protein
MKSNTPNNLAYELKKKEAKKNYLKYLEHMYSLYVIKGKKVDHEAKWDVAQSKSVEELGRNPVHDAVSCNNLGKVRSLLDNGADVNAPDHYDITPLHMATKAGNVTIAQLLLDNGADVNAQDFYGETPLLIAAKACNAEVVQLLLDNGANVNVQDFDGKILLDVVATHCC